MPSPSGTTPVSNTTLGANQFPAAAVYVPGTSGGNFTALQGGPVSTDNQNKDSAPVAVYVPDGYAVTIGTTTDASTVNTLIGLTKAIKANTANITLASLPAGSNTIGNVQLVNGANTASISSGGALKVDNSAVTQPVSGTFWQTTQPVSAASLPLPSGASTSAKQPALGTAGSASTDVLTVQGIASMTALKVDGSGVTQPVSGTFWQATQPISGTVTANAGTGNFTVVQGTGTNLHTVVDSGTVAATQSGTWTVNAGSGTFTNQQSNNTTDYDTGAGTQTMTMFGVALPASGGAVAGGTSSNPIRVDPTGTTTQPVSGTFWQATQPVSGTVTANIGTTNGVALDTSVNGLLVSQGSTTSGEKGPLIQGAVTTSAPTYTTAQTSPISLTTAGAIRVDASATTQPVSGTVSAAQSGTWNITNVSGTVSLPTGAATSAKQPALGTAGSASSDVLTVQGITSMTALKVDGSAVTQPVSGTVTANQGGSNWSANVAQIGGTNVVTGGASGLLAVGGPVASGSSNADNPVKVGAVYNSTQPTVTTGQIVDAQATARGARIVATGVDTFNVTVNAALPAGTNVIGHVIADSGSTTAVTQATAANLNATATIQAVTGTSIAVGNNALPILNSAATGYVAAYGSNAAALTANTDYAFKWGASGTTQVNHIMLQNNTSINILFDLDTATNSGSPYLAPGQTIFFDVQTTAFHLQGNGTPNVNGSSASNVVVRGWL